MRRTNCCGRPGESGLVRYLGRVFGNEATVGRVPGADPARMGHRRGGFRTTGGVAAAAAGGGDRAQDGQDRARLAERLVGTSDGDVCKKLSHPTDACRSVGAERNRRVTTPVILFAPVPSLRTPPVLLARCSFGQWNLCSVVAAVSRCGQPGSAADRGVSLGHLRSARSFLPNLSRGLADGRHWRQFPIVWKGGAPFNAGLPPCHVPRGGTRNWRAPYRGSRPGASAS